MGEEASSFVFSLPMCPCAPFLGSIHLLYEGDWGRVSFNIVSWVGGVGGYAGEVVFASVCAKGPTVQI